MANILYYIWKISVVLMEARDLTHEYWVETIAIILLMIGFVLAITINEMIYVYLVILLAGLIVGRFFFFKIGRKPLFPFVLIIVFFLLGYIMGSFSANRKVVVLLFVIGWVVSHMLHKKGYIPK